MNAHGKVFERILHANSVPTDRVVIQIQEGLVEQDKQLTEAIDNYRDRGYKIAIDHFGSNQSHIDRLWKLSPDFVKLDSTLIQKAESNERLHKILPGLIQVIRDLAAQPIIAGIDTQTQLDIAIESGVNLLQGIFLGKAVAAKELQKSQIFKPSTARLNLGEAA